VIVLDASVVLKWVLRDEPGAPDALDLRSQHLGGVEPVAVPELLFYEVANAMVQSRRLTKDQADQAWDDLVQLGLVSYALRSQGMRRAMELARAARMTVHDAVYIALAEALQCDLVTADLKLARKAKSRKLACKVWTI